MKINIFLFFAILYCGLANAATYTASTTGAWSTPGTWAGGSAPASGGSDDIVINTGVTVTMDAAFSTTGTLTLNGTGIIQMAGYNLTIGTLSAIGSSTINNSGANATLTEGSANAISAFTGTITGDINITKTGTATFSIQGGTSLTAASTITNSGSGNLELGRNVTDSYAGDMTFTVTSSGGIYIAYTSGLTTTFSGNLILNCTGSGGIYFGRTGSGGNTTLASGKTISIGGSGYSAGGLNMYNFTQTGATAQNLTTTGSSGVTFGTSTVFNGDLTVVTPSLYLNGATFNGTTSLTVNGSTSNASNGGNTFNNPLTITHSGSNSFYLASTSADTYNSTVDLKVTSSGSLFAAYASSSNAFNENITVNNTGSGTLYFGWSGGSATLAASKTISVGASGFSSGTLDLRRFTQTGGTAQTITLTGTASIYLATSTVFNGNLTVTTPSIRLDGVTCNGTATFNKNGGTADDVSTGGCIFGSTFIFNNSSGYRCYQKNDTYNGTATFNATGTKGIFASGTFNSTATFNDATTAADFSYISYQSSSTFNDDVIIKSTSTSGGNFYISASGYSTTFNDNVEVNGTSTGPLYFGGGDGTVSLATGKTITVGATGFSAGSLKLKNFTQTGATSQTLTLTGTAALYFESGTTFNGALTATAPQLYLNGSTFNSTATLEKDGATSNTSTGSNTFNNTFTVTNSGSGTMTLGGTPAFTMGAAGSVVCSSSRTLNISGSIVNGGYTLTANIEGTSTFSGINSGTGAFIKTGSGSLTFSGANTYTGTTTLTAGTLALGASGVIADGSNIIMNGATLSTGGYSETMGTLTMTANSVLALGAGVHSINFAASDGTTWTGGALFKVTGWTGGYNSTSGTAGKLYTGASAELAAGKVAQVFFMNPTNSLPYTAVQLSDGEIVPTSTLPVELVSFTAEKVDSDVELNWATASEINSDYFVVLRSSDGLNFKELAKVKAQGTSYHLVNYNFLDENPIDGINYYKLIEYDFDGKSQESKVLGVTVKSSKDEIVQLYPNPAQEKTTLYFNSLEGGIYKLKIIDLNGKEFYAAMIPAMNGENKFQLNFTDYPPSTYFILLINSTNEVSQLRVVKY